MDNKIEITGYCVMYGLGFRVEVQGTCYVYLRRYNPNNDPQLSPLFACLWSPVTLPVWFGVLPILSRCVIRSSIIVEPSED